MTLDDIDWRAGELTVRGKGRTRERLPLPAEVGQALAAYLREGRPSCSTRHLFVTARALEKIDPYTTPDSGRFRPDDQLLAFLNNL